MLPYFIIGAVVLIILCVLRKMPVVKEASIKVWKIIDIGIKGDDEPPPEEPLERLDSSPIDGRLH